MVTYLRRADPEEAGMSSERVRRIRDLARSWVEEDVTPALVVLAARHGVIVIHEAIGRLGPEPDARPVEQDTVFPVASISKPITAALAMILVDDGLLGLNRPVQEYIPEFVGEGKSQVMVHHLLTHTSGLTDEDADAHLKRKSSPGLWSLFEGRRLIRDEWVAGCLDAPLSRPPGVEMAYCSTGYEILGEVIQRVSGESLDALARQRLFGPLGMTSTWFAVPESADSRIVRIPPGAKLAAADAEWFRRAPFACGGAFSTASDLAAFGQMTLEGGALGGVRILSRASVAEMIRNQIPGISSDHRDEYFPEASWGFGWNVEGNKDSLRKGSLLSERAISHGGASGTYIWIDPAYDLVGVYLSVVLDNYPNGMEKWNADLFSNAVTAAIEDA